MAIGGGKNIGGLLGTDFQDPRTQGVLGLASGLLSAGGPSVGRPEHLFRGCLEVLPAYQGMVGWSARVW